MSPTDLQQPYSDDLFLQIVDGLIDEDFEPSGLEIKVPDNTKHILGITNHGEFPNLSLYIFSVKHTKSLEARVAVTRDIFQVMKAHNFRYALVASYTDNEGWRCSFISSDLELTESGKVTKKFSNPKRYSFSLGEDQKVNTPYEQLIKMDAVREIDELKERFAIEVVNNKFYKEIAKLYDELVGTDKVKPQLKYPGTGEESHEFAVRLIGRIIFCWFLREKKSADGIPLIPSDIISREAAEVSCYYHSVLAPLFFEVLNRPLENRTPKFQQNGFKDVPYLNGGLFSDDEIDHYNFDKSLEVSISGLVNVPDEWLRKLFDLLERYNFTVDENTSYDTDLSIDPEMLGRVFENLLARINPETGKTVRESTGSFYTPREIVDYMVDSSLTEYLATKTDVDRQKLQALVSYDLLDDVGYELSKNESEDVLEALSALTVLDPACGSGAFPIGMLQKIVHVISILDPEAEWWLEKQLKGATPELRREFENRGLDYIRKLGIIRKTIFGVDIQPVATEISRLRCFLTLVVDEVIDDTKSNRGIRPLPNLEFKFVTANSLVKPPQDDSSVNASLFEDFGTKLSSKVKDYFGAQGAEKLSLLNDIRDLIDEKADQNTSYVLNNQGIIRDERFADEYNKKNKDTSTKLLNEAEIWKSYKNIFTNKPVKFFETEYFFPSVDGGFDIVIGNPPYFQLKKGIYSSKVFPYSEGKDKGKQNIYKLFIEHAYNTAKHGGITCMIVQSSLMCDISAKHTRELLLTNTRIKQFVEFPKKSKSSKHQVFDNVLQGTCIFLFNKMESDGHSEYSFNISVGNDTGTINNLQFESIDQKKIFSLYPLGYEIPLIRRGDGKVLAKLSENVSTLKDCSVEIIKGDLNLGTEKKEFSTKMTDTKLFRGKNINRYSMTYETSEYINNKEYKNLLSKKNFDNEYILLQNITGTTDQWRLHGCAVEKGVQYLVGDSAIKILIKPEIKNRAILGILNSQLIDWLFRKTSTNNHVNVYEVEQLPIANKSLGNSSIINNLDSLVAENIERKKKDTNTSDLEGKINKLVYELYNLTSEEVQIVEREAN